MHQARIAVRRSASHMKGSCILSKNRFVRQTSAPRAYFLAYGRGGNTTDALPVFLGCSLLLLSARSLSGVLPLRRYSALRSTADSTTKTACYPIHPAGHLFSPHYEILWFSPAFPDPWYPRPPPSSTIVVLWRAFLSPPLPSSSLGCFSFGPFAQRPIA